MALELIETAGASNANTYCSLADAETYFEGRLHKADWSAATDADKNAALAMATRLLDSMIEWEGFAATDEQALLWPRFWVLDKKGYAYDSNEIPVELRDSTAEFALFLLDEDWSVDPDTSGFSALSVGPLSMTIDRSDRRKSIPDSAVQMVKHLGKYNSGGYNQRTVRA